MKTASVKFYKAQNSKHALHPLKKFAQVPIIPRKTAFQSPAEITFHSQDDKAKVPIRLPAANKQAPMVMHIRVSLKLIPKKALY